MKWLVLTCLFFTDKQYRGPTHAKGIKMVLKLLVRSGKRFVKISLVFNFIIVVYICVNHVNWSPSHLEHEVARDRLLEAYRNVRQDTGEFPIPTTVKQNSTKNESSFAVMTKPPMCLTKILLFGMRQHWFEFCSFKEFSQYKYLIQFPRFIECPETNCFIFLNYSLEAKDLADYDVVLFTDVYQWLTPEMWDWAHGNRSKGQRWVMITEESPLYVPGVQPPLKYANNSYDWFDSYKTDSDFVHSYGYYVPYAEGERVETINLRELVQNKTKLVAWMGSHCETLQWNRKMFVQDMQRVIHLEKYGRCGEVEIPWNNYEALQETLTPYKFYLSLENSCCEDYITEKFWRALELGLVPVVVGAPFQYYRKVAPPNSFIHPDQFESMAEMALHLVDLNANNEKYLEYFKWRNLGKLVSYGQEEHYVRPLTNNTQCSIQSKQLASGNSPSNNKRRYFGREWFGSCNKCGAKQWMEKYMLPRDYARENDNIWA